MNIQPANTYNLNTNFKATYPVMHWVAETNGSYAPITNMDLVKKLQGKIIRMLNKPLKDSVKKMNPVEQNLRAYIGGCDSAYRVLPRVRSFYNRITGGFGRYTPVSYIISGKDVEVFDNYLAKNIGRAKAEAKDILNNPYSAKAIEAIRQYNTLGLDFVNANSKRIKDSNGIMYTLHTKFEIIRNKYGKIKDYRFVDARFMPDRKVK